MTLSKHTTVANLPKNLRFYILLFSLLLALITIGWLRTNIESTQLFKIRLEQAFGLYSILFLYIALFISPLSKVFKKARVMPFVMFSRRAVGVSAAGFALLHAVIAFWGQIGGFDGAILLPERFKAALILGLIALVVLLAMAATSFDKVVSFMTLKRWKILHRSIYIGGVLIILHVWMIGTHMAYPWAKIVGLFLLGLFFAFESWRIAKDIGKRFKNFSSPDYIAVIALSLWALWMCLLISMPSFVGNYHGKHASDHENTQQVGSHE